jgi:two-component system, sensor histidine kinase
MRILIADDDAINRKLLSTQLKKANILADVASDGNQAVSMYIKDPSAYSAILLDLHMPHMNGDEACKEIRKYNKSIPIAVITGEAAMKEELLQSGFNEVLVKPLVGGAHIDIICQMSEKYAKSLCEP